MNYSFKNNQGMYTECLVNKTIGWYEGNDIALFKKSYVPVSLSNVQGERVSGKIISNADVDYYGIYKGKYIAFEVKETWKDSFLFSSIKGHQFDVLKKVFIHGGVSFLLINFLNNEEDGIWIIFFEKLTKIYQKNKKKISNKEIKEVGVNLKIKFPGIIDFVDAIDKKNI